MSLRRILTVARLELRTTVAGPLFWGLAGLAFLAGLPLNVTTFTGGEGAVRPFVNSPHALAWLFAMTGFLVVAFFAAILAGTATLRDDEHRVTPLLRSSGLRRSEYLGGKLAGACAALVLALGVHLAATVLHVQLAPLDDALARGPFRWSHFLVPWLLFPLPLCWFSAALAFVVGERTRRPMAVFVVPVALLFGIAWVMAWTPPWLSPAGDRLLMILDPSGLRWLLGTVLSEDRGVLFYNTAPLPLDATFLAGRLWTLLAPVLLVAWAVGRPAPGTRHRRRSAGDAAAGDAAAVAPAAAAAQPLPGAPPVMTSRPPHRLAALAQITRGELRELAGQPGLYAFALLLVAAVWDAATSARGPYGAALLPTPGPVAVGSLGVITILVCLILQFYVAQSLTRERTTRLAPLLHTTPVPSHVLLLGKGLAHGVLVAALLLACLAVALLVLARGGGPVDPGPLMLVWGGVLLPGLLLWTAFVTALATLLRNPYAVYAVALGTLGWSLYHLSGDGVSWPTHWTLLGALRWSDLGLFPLNAAPLLLNRLLAVAAALFLVAVAAHAYPRVAADPAAVRRRLHPRHWWRPAVTLALLATPALVLAGTLAVGVDRGFQGSAAAPAAAAESHLPGAHLRAIDLRVGLAPAARRADVEGTLTLINPTAEPMARLALTVGPDLRDVRWWIDGVPATPQRRSGLHVLRLATPLPPGGRCSLRVSYRLVRPDGFTRSGGGAEQFILPAGVLLHTLRDSFLPLPAPGSGAAVPGAGHAAPFDSRLEITAPEQLTVVASGHRVRQHTRDGRTTVVWETAHPVRALSLAAGRWEERRRRGAAVYHHPGHPHNVERMLDVLIAARKHYGAWFHPYPWRDLKISEFPDLATNALGFATHVPVSEGLGFLAAPNQPDHPVFLVVAHEAAHQWWGNLLAPAAGPGTGHLVEGMAHYAALRLLEAEHGPEARRQLARQMERHYLERRRRATERPLLEMADGDGSSTWTVVYEKGAWVTWMLQQHLGRQAFDAGLQSFLRRHADVPSYPTTEDLLDHLRPHAPDRAAYDGFVDRWFRQVVLPEYRISGAEVEPAGDGWRVRATVANVGSGSVPVEVAVQGTGPAAPSRRLHLHPEPGRPAMLAVDVGFAPHRIEIDPDVEVLQRNRDKAVLELEAGVEGTETRAAPARHPAPSPNPDDS